MSEATDLGEQSIKKRKRKKKVPGNSEIEGGSGR
jgi:hypothetical protein